MDKKKKSHPNYRNPTYNYKSLSKTKTNSQSKNANHEIKALTKKLESTEHILKIEQKKQKDVKSNFEKQLTQIMQNKLNLEKDLDNTLKELNEKEALIYNIQKQNFELFKHEITKYHKVLTQLQTQLKEKEKQFNNISTIELIQENNTEMLNEERLSHVNEINIAQNKAELAFTSLKELEDTYPDDFSFLKEDFDLTKELDSAKSKLELNNKNIKKIKNENIILDKSKQSLTKQLTSYEEELTGINEKLYEEGKNDCLNKLESHIVQNISQVYLWNCLKDVIVDFYKEKIFNEDNGDYIDATRTVWEKRKIFIQNESIKTKKNIDNQIQVLTTRLNEVNPNNTKEIEQLQTKLNKLNKTMDNVNQSYSQIFTCLQSFIDLLPQIDINDPKHSGDLMDNHFIEIAKTLNNTVSTISEDEKKNFLKLIEVYRNELYSKTKILKSLHIKQFQITKQIEKLSTEIKTIDDQKKLKDIKIQEINYENTDLTIKKNDITNKLKKRNMNMQSNLEKISEDQYNRYLLLNQNTLKNMGKIYGKKIVNKVNKIQKEKFYESILLSHGEKKQMLRVYISYINTFETTRENYKTEIDALTEKYTKEMEVLMKIKIERNKIGKEKNILEDSCKELKNMIENCLTQQEKNFKLEKTKLQRIQNIPFLIEKTKEFSKKREQLNKEELKLYEQIEKVGNEFSQRERDLHKNDLNLKNNLINLKFGINDDQMNHQGKTTLPYKHGDIY